MPYPYPDDPKDPAPTVHENGTDAAELLKTYDDTANALRAAQGQLVACAPHQCDYSLDGFELARAAHCNRLHRLYVLLNEVATLHASLRERIAVRDNTAYFNRPEETP